MNENSGRPIFYNPNSIGNKNIISIQQTIKVNSFKVDKSQVDEQIHQNFQNDIISQNLNEDQNKK